MSLRLTDSSFLFIPVRICERKELRHHKDRYDSQQHHREEELVPYGIAEETGHCASDHH